MFRLHIRFCLAFFFSLLRPFTAIAAEPDALMPGWQVRIDGAIHSGRSLYRVGALGPIAQTESSLFFLDSRIGTFDGEVFEANLGFAWRGQPAERSVIVGLYGFGDYRKTEEDNTITQVALGIEALWPRYTFRANAYYPEKKRHLIDRRFLVPEIALVGTTVVETRGTLDAYEYALPGFDIEIGYHHPLTDRLELAIFSKYFRFERDQAPLVEGENARMELRGTLRGWNVNWSAGAEYRHDGVRGSDTFAVFRVEVPLGAGPESTVPAERRRFAEPVYRDHDVVSLAEDINKPVTADLGPTLGGVLNKPVENPVSGQPLQILTAAGVSGGDCSLASPCSFNTAVAQSRPGDFIFLSGGNGELRASGGVSLGSDVQLRGVGDSGVVELPTSAGTIRIADTGGRPDLFLSPGANIQMNRGVSISGIQLSAAESDTVVGAPLLFGSRDTGTDISIDDVVFENTGLLLVNANDVVVNNSVFRSTGRTRELIQFQDSAGVTLRNSVLENTLLASTRTRRLIVENNRFLSSRIYTYQAHEYRIHNNTFDRSLPFEAILIEGHGTGLISGNRLNGTNGLGTAIEIRPRSVAAQGLTGLVNFMGVRVEGNTISNWDQGFVAAAPSLQPRAPHQEQPDVYHDFQIELLNNTFENSDVRVISGIVGACLDVRGNRIQGAGEMLLGGTVFPFLEPQGRFILEGVPGSFSLAAEAVSYAERANNLAAVAFGTFAAGDCSAQ